MQLEKHPVTGSRGVVVTNHPLGSAAGIEMLAAGGNAVDAVIASLFALTVVEPMMVGIFGAGMTNIRRADGSNWFLNNYAVAPAASAADMYQTVSDTWPRYQETENGENDVGPLAVGVPGSLKGWCETLEACGTFRLADVLQPAIRYAREGFLVTPYLAGIVSAVAESMRRFPETAKTFMPGGSPIKSGDRLVQKEYAETLTNIGVYGPEYLYEGVLGSVTIDYLQRVGGILTRDDLSQYRTFPQEPVVGEYRGHAIIGPAPPSAGGVQVVEMLNILEHYDLGSMGFASVDAMHILAEVLKIGFEDRKQYTGDPLFVDVPIDMLVSKSFASQRREWIKIDRARPTADAVSGESPHTTHLAAADSDGNVVASTQTIHAPFGSKVTVPGTGMLLNNTMNIFDPHSGHANSIAPGKRMTSSMSPIIVTKNDDPLFTLGLPGATKIFPSAMQAIINTIDHQMTPQQAVEAPRLWTQGQDVEVEPGFPIQVLRELQRRGHKIKEVPLIGGGMGFIGFRDQEIIGASCWRADGTPMAIGGGMARMGSRFNVR